MFNRWKEFPKIKPTKDRWYECTVEVPGQQRYTMNLYWYGDRGEDGKFIDNIRDNVCECYTVLGYKGNRLTDIGQDRTSSVVAWKKTSNPYMKGFIKDDSM